MSLTLISRVSKKLKLNLEEENGIERNFVRLEVVDIDKYYNVKFSRKT